MAPLWPLYGPLYGPAIAPLCPLYGPSLWPLSMAPLSGPSLDKVGSKACGWSSQFFFTAPREEAATVRVIVSEYVCVRGE